MKPRGGIGQQKCPGHQDSERQRSAQRFFLHDDTRQSQNE